MLPEPASAAGPEVTNSKKSDFPHAFELYT